MNGYVRYVRAKGISSQGVLNNVPTVNGMGR
jgi:hypothetical protein